jgi:hypothetical protein
MEKNNSFCNLYKFRIYTDNEVLSERVFSADEYNQVVKYQIDIRSMINNIQKRVQKVLSASNNDLHFNFNGQYNTLKYFKDRNSKYGYSNLESIEENSITINDKVYKGSEIKIGIFLNSNPIFERSLYINRYNPNSRFSVELYEVVYDIVEDIKDKIKKDDIKLMWEDFDLMNHYNYVHISQIRELSQEERSRQLYRIYSK